MRSRRRVRTHEQRENRALIRLAVAMILAILIVFAYYRVLSGTLF